MEILGKFAWRNRMFFSNPDQRLPDTD